MAHHDLAHHDLAPTDPTQPDLEGLVAGPATEHHDASAYAAGARRGLSSDQQSTGRHLRVAVADPDRDAAADAARSADARRRGRLRRIVRSLIVSVATSGLSLTILAILTLLSVTSPAVANVVATLAGIGPSFALNRRWVWKRLAPGHMRREILPFWSYAIAALVLSTLAVDLVASWADSTGASATRTTVAVLAANLSAFGALWCGQFVLLDRILTRPEPRPSFQRAHGDPGRSPSGSAARE